MFFMPGRIFVVLEKCKRNPSERQAPALSERLVFHENQHSSESRRSKKPKDNRPNEKKPVLSARGGTALPRQQIKPFFLFISKKSHNTDCPTIRTIPETIWFPQKDA